MSRILVFSFVVGGLFYFTACHKKKLPEIPDKDPIEKTQKEAPIWSDFFSTTSDSTIEFFTDTSSALISDTIYVSSTGDTLLFQFIHYALNDHEIEPRIVAPQVCNFIVKEELINNYGLKVKAFYNKKQFFAKDFKKSEFDKILEKNFLKYHIISGGDFFSYNEKQRQVIIRINLAQRQGGTDWFGQVYCTFDLNGKLVNKGLVDYPHHCQDMITISPDSEYILTCSEIAHFSGTKRKFDTEKNIALARFLNDTLYTLVYAATKDSILCDTVIFWKEDTLSFVNYAHTPDTITNNAFILHVKGDTLAQFQFSGYTDFGEGFYTEVATLKQYNLVGYFDFKRKYLHIVDIANLPVVQCFGLNKLKRLNTEPRNSRTYLQFYAYNEDGKTSIIRFFINPNKTILGYTLL